ncbi:hypothetical protein F5X68DRAFT_198139 [Plectosphaerella plurivora]|uniref:Uncharacterized protein n=1 Tax=Plectosphaerella plurivora TaxID=936078 RepID=A0A9P9AH91_9PEZI|nr:hypothetical protein F5X68DRAFT_198139 [Plectosphaerella plurivora]
MQFTLTSVLALATLAAAGPLAPRSQSTWDFPESMPLAARQATPEPGTPLYACHENCGLTVSGSREADYCTNWQWIARFDACLNCANEFNIWQYYGTTVTRVGTACGLDATPV